MNLEEMVIEFVSQHPCLYDKNDKHYNDKRFKEATWDQIQLVDCQPNIKPKTARNKWESLLNKYTQIHRSVVGRESQERLNTFRFYDQMKFIAPHISQQITNDKTSISTETTCSHPETREKPLCLTTSPKIADLNNTSDNPSLRSELESSQQETTNFMMTSPSLAEKFVRNSEYREFEFQDQMRTCTPMSNMPNLEHPGYSSTSQVAYNQNTPGFHNTSTNSASSSAFTRIPPRFAQIEMNPLCSMPQPIAQSPIIMPPPPHNMINPNVYFYDEDESFMRIVTQEIKKLKPKKKLLFKSKIYELLHQLFE